MYRMGLIVSALIFCGATAASSGPLSQTDFVGTVGMTYDIVWDGHVGELTLAPPGASSKLVGADKVQRLVRYQILQEPQTYVAGKQGPGFAGTASALHHRIVFWVDFAGTPSNANDDQRFDGYMMTQTHRDLAGVTWWGGIPFGFFARTKGPIVP